MEFHQTNPNLRSSRDSIDLYFFNKAETDIWLKPHFDDLQKKDSRFLVKHILSEPDSSFWTGETGRISKDLVEKAAKSSDFAFVCGPRIFNDIAAQLLLDSKLDTHCFQG
jgi:NAD(P)H-flavin reductase